MSCQQPEYRPQVTDPHFILLVGLSGVAKFSHHVFKKKNHISFMVFDSILLS